MRVFLLASASIVVSVCAQFMLKAGMSSAAVQSVLGESSPLAVLQAVVRSPQVLLGLTLYGLGAVAWLGVLAHWDVSKAYPLVGLGFGLTVLVGWMLGEHVTAVRVAGVALICAGVVLAGRS